MVASLLMLSTKPMPIYIAKSAEPPCEKNGNGTPVFGSIDVATPTFINVCIAIQLATPTHIKLL